MMFSSTVRWGERLKCWKTIPMTRRWVVDATQQRGLAGTGRADQAGHRALRDLKVNALEHVEAAVVLPHIAESNHGDVHRLFSVTLSSSLMEILRGGTPSASVKAASWR